MPDWIGPLPATTNSHPRPASASGLCLHERFQQCVRIRPDAVAVSADGESLTYRELNRRANRLARRLRCCGLPAEARVGLLLPRCADLVVAVLASPERQAERLLERESRAGRAALTDAEIAERLAAQLPPEEKARRADYVIHTDTSIEATRDEVAGVWQALLSL